MTAHSQTQSHLQGYWLIGARLAWAAVSILTLVIFLFALPVRYAQLLSPEDEIRVGLTRLGYATQYIEQYGTEAAAHEAVAPLGLAPAEYANLFFTLEVLVTLVYVGIGLIVAWRKFQDGFGLFASAFFIAFGVGGSSYQLVPLIVYHPAGFIFGGLVTTLAYTLMPPFFYLFPNGRWVPRWGWVPAALWAFTTCLWNFAPRSPLNPTNWPLWLYFLNIGFIWGSAALAQIYRYRKISSGVQRQQTKWLVFGFGFVVLVSVPPIIFLPLIFPTINTETLYSLLIPLQVLTLSVIPIALGISILRYRLWDIDLIIRRTLQYSVLSGLLALTYFGLVIVLQNLTSAIGGQRSEFVTVLSTLAIAALFFPLRNRVQEFIDKRFYRKKYDAQKVLAEFAATCRDETDLDKLVTRLEEVIDETLQPEKVSVWLKPEKPVKRET